MSDISLLSYHYQRIVEISNKINEAVILLRKRAMSSDIRLAEQHKNLAVQNEVIVEAREDLLFFLGEIKKVFDNKEVAKSDLPDFLIRSFDQLVKNDPYLKSDLDNLILTLESGKDLSSLDFELLDKLLSVVDKDRSNVFRKLRSRRG